LTGKRWKNHFVLFIEKKKKLLIFLVIVIIQQIPIQPNQNYITPFYYKNKTRYYLMTSAKYKKKDNNNFQPLD